MRRIPITIGAVLIGAAIGFAGVYGVGGLKRSVSGDPACRGAVDLARRLTPRTSPSRTPEASQKSSPTGADASCW
jgi:uncharacterized membrane protein YccC